MFDVKPANDDDTPRRFGLSAGITCFCFWTVAGCLSISQSKNSTAVVGYFFLPFYSAIVAGLAFIAGWCAGYFLVWYRSPTRTGRRSAIVAALVPVVLIIAATWRVTTFNAQRDGLAAMRLAARSPNTAPEYLEELAASTNEYVLGDAAGNPKLSQATLRRLANRGGYLVEWGLAHNPATPRDSLTRLAGSPNEYARGYVAANPNTPAKVLAELSKDRIAHVRWSVTLNPSTPQEIVEALMEDTDEFVRRVANSASLRYKRP